MLRCDILYHAFVRQKSGSGRALQCCPFHIVVQSSAAISIGHVDQVQKIVTVLQEWVPIWLERNAKHVGNNRQDSGILEDYLLGQFYTRICLVCPNIDF